jgi:translation initiation factor 1
MALVYSTDAGRMCPACRKPVADCACGQKKAPAGDGIARVSREKRNGKTVTVVKGLPLPADELMAFSKQLRAQCGSGGTVKDFVVEVQGDHADKVMALLAEAGYKAKRAGG